MYPDSFNHKISKSCLPLTEWLKETGMKHEDAAKALGFQKVSIQKMIGNENRDIRVWADSELVEIKKVDVKAIRVQGEMIGYPTNQSIIMAVKLIPKGKMDLD
tara:strand:- start:573 stop:881 length:309 start_codon:yes stop_codon:yes gene_type:complete